MDFLDGLRAFVATAQAGSFAQGAERLGISNRLASKYVAGLEERLGVRLLQRTTRRVGTTPEGEELLRRAPALLDGFDEMLAGISEGKRGLSGNLRVSAPVTYGQSHVQALLRGFALAHPDLVIDLRLDDAYADLAAQGVDVAFRIGTSSQRLLVQRRIGTITSLLIASEDYIARRGIPASPADLAHHDCIADTNHHDPALWPLTRQGMTVEAQIHPRFMVNSAHVALGLAQDGLGIAFCPDFVTAPDLAALGLVRLLPDYDGPVSPVSMVWLEGRILPRKVRSLIDYVVAETRKSLS
ncbi:LysR family transcriptional regulator [Pseudogemmobacter bohemicus]|uniref:LysR family transcriptional regulator n=1 Tax=Pseudogemmobacter bohemicus TaxID=2250708 RepID=UPI000DD30E39|nr:LysR family transcriptional regulator [Pseudogemmobacter bohemicus]